MSQDTAVRIINVSKKFRRGEIHDSLRDFIPGVISAFLRQGLDGLRREEFWALRDVSIDVTRGEAFGIIGHNGAGKSTLLKLLSRIILPTTGEVHVKGRLSALIEVGAGFHPDLTGRENIFLNGAILGMSRTQIVSKLEQIVEFAGLEEFLDTPIKRYSSGMYARLGFAVAAHVDPEILIVDEVLSVGDWAFQRKCEARMRELIGSGATVIFVSHNLAAVTSLCGRCALLDHGSVVTIGMTEEVVAKYLNDQTKRQKAPNNGVLIEEVKFLRNEAEAVHFDEGEAAVIRVRLRSEIASSHLTVVVYLADGRFYQISEAYIDILAGELLSVVPGGETVLEIEVKINLGPGTYYVGCVVRDLKRHVEYDRRFPIGSLFVSGEGGTKGAANLFPKLIKRETHPGAGHTAADRPS
jgi:lipopolysaccharide transport system ATP-binding protein